MPSESLAESLCMTPNPLLPRLTNLLSALHNYIEGDLLQPSAASSLWSVLEQPNCYQYPSSSLTLTKTSESAFRIGLVDDNTFLYRMSIEVLGLFSFLIVVCLLLEQCNDVIGLKWTAVVSIEKT
jgi:hypothetical protein